MEQIGFRMQLNQGQAVEYRRRHDEIWPELVSLLKEADISDYSIFLHEDTNSLFAVLRRAPDQDF
jgi:L-rhamnose mutarotase